MQLFSDSLGTNCRFDFSYQEFINLVYEKKYLDPLVNENILQNMKETLLKKRKNYKQIEALKIKSRVEKDREFYELVASENSYLATLKEINSLKRQIADFKLRKAQLERSIKDKYLLLDFPSSYGDDKNTKLNQNAC